MGKRRKQLVLDLRLLQRSPPNENLHLARRDAETNPLRPGVNLNFPDRDCEGSHGLWTWPSSKDRHSETRALLFHLSQWFERYARTRHCWQDLREGVQSFAPTFTSPLCERFSRKIILDHEANPVPVTDIRRWFVIHETDDLTPGS
jgi:hypothetical protein